MEEQKRKGVRVKDIISTIFIICLLIFASKFYKRYNFNDFIKAEANLRVSKFERDSEVKVSDSDSYRITNQNFNDAIFYEKVKVTPNTAYRVSCKIKTKDVVSKNKNSDSGAHISIADTYEKSDNVSGTTDWQEITFYFNSKSREEVNLGFRLGGAEDECKRYSLVFRF